MIAFDPAAEFLLTNTNYESLFEPAGPGESNTRCKGCRQIVKRWERQAHWGEHKASMGRLEEARRLQLKQERIANLAKARLTKQKACTCGGGGIGVCMCSARKEQAA